MTRGHLIDEEEPVTLVTSTHSLSSDDEGVLEGGGGEAA